MFSSFWIWRGRDSFNQRSLIRWLEAVNFSHWIESFLHLDSLILFISFFGRVHYPLALFALWVATISSWDIVRWQDRVDAPARFTRLVNVSDSNHWCCPYLHNNDSFLPERTVSLLPKKCWMCKNSPAKQNRHFIYSQSLAESDQYLRKYVIDPFTTSKQIQNHEATNLLQKKHYFDSGKWLIAVHFKS